MKYLLLIFTFFSIFYLGKSQIVTIKDRDNGKPLEKVTLASKNPSLFITTNSIGQADISQFKNSDKIEIRMMGYLNITRTYAEIENQNFVVFLAPKAISFDQIVVSSVRWNQPKIEVQSRISIINTQETRLQNPQTAADLLSSTSEVFIQKSQQGGGSPMIRGFSTNRLLYVIDGVRMNTAIFRSGNLQNVISLDVFTIENAEVLFGPGSVIYGSDAIGGVMTFQTLSPEISLSESRHIKGNATIRYSSANNEKTGHFDINVGWQKWAFLTSISSNDFGDLKMGHYGPKEYLSGFYVERENNTDIKVINADQLVQTPTGYSQMNLMQKIRFKPSDNWDINYGLHYSATSDYSRYDRLIRTRKNLPRSAEWYYGPQIWQMNNLSISNTEKNIFFDQADMRLAHQYFQESRIDRDFNDVVKRNRTEKVDAISANIDFTKSFGDVSLLYYGLEAVYNKVKSTGYDTDITMDSISDGPSRYPESDWQSYALYLTYRYNFSEKLLLQTGARYSVFALNADFTNNIMFYPLPFREIELNEGTLTGNLGLVYHPTNEWSIGWNLSTGFRSPNVDDIGKIFDSEPGSVVVPNSNLSAEYVYNAEINIAKIFGDYLKIDFSAYYTYLDKALVRRNFKLNGQDSIMYNGELSQVQAVQNAAWANVYGIQTGLEVKLPYGFALASHFNYQKGDEELDDGSKSPTRHAPPWFGVSKLIYKYDKVLMQFYVQYSGEKSFQDMPQEERSKGYIYAIDKDGNPYSPSWTTINFKASYQLSDLLSISVGLENIADQRYRTYSSGIVAPGRNFVLSLAAGF